MAHLPLARKWRPQRFEDVIGQRGVVETLKHAISSGRLAQAFIFAGPRGVGKTTTARILARALNCVHGPTPEPCGTCDACREIAESGDMDVFEIDGATYTGVDDVRELIVVPLAIAPLRDRFKIFIIDEVHRLSKNAFDSLLKAIEEPPSHVKFMMATTDLHAVPETIQSRSQVFELRALPFAAIREELGAVTTREGITIDAAALALVARAAEGSMRDALGALDQVLAFAGTAVTGQDVSTVLGLLGRDLQFQIVDLVAREDLAAAFQVAGTVVESGVDLRGACRELARLVRDLLVIKIDPTRRLDPEIAAEGERDRLVGLAETFSREDLLRSFDLLSRLEFEIRGSSQPRQQFEMGLVKWIHLRRLTPIEDLIASLSGGPAPATLTPGPRPAAALPSGSTAPPRPAPRPTERPAAPARPEARPPADTDEPADAKARLFAAVKEQHKVLYGMVVSQATRVDFEGDAVVFSFAPAQKSLRIELDRKRAVMEQVAQQALGRRVRVVTREVASEPVAAPVAPGAARQQELRDRAKADPAVQSVLDVFGGEVEDVEEID